MASATQHDNAGLAVIDSGLGGISVVRALRRAAPALGIVYAADRAGFPYGDRSADEITARGIALVAALHAAQPLGSVVVACNTLSTLALGALRAAFPAIRFTGTVPAIKVAAAASRSLRFSLLATPNTAHSAYSRDLAEQFAQGCVVDAVGAPNLARYAEAWLLGEAIDDAQWRQEIAPCFHDDAAGRTDAVVLGCTHYPLVRAELERVAPWPVQWIDSSAAIARQALTALPAGAAGPSLAYLTGAEHTPAYAARLRAEGFADCRSLTLAAASEPAAIPSPPAAARP